MSERHHNIAKMRRANTILYFHSGADLYGASRSLLRLTSRLEMEGTRVIVVLPYDGPLAKILSAVRVEVRIDDTMAIVTRAQMRRVRDVMLLPLRIVRSIVATVRLIRDVRPDLVHTNTAIVLSSGIAARIARVPHVWHVRESFAEFGILWRPYQWYMYLFSTRIICVSEAVRQQFNPDIQKRSAIVIHNGIPLSEFEPVNEDRVLAFRKAHGLEGSLLVGVVGRLKMVRKGQDTFLRAASLVVPDFPRVRFVLIGSPFPGNESHQMALIELARSLGIDRQVVFAGDIDDMRAAYAALDVSVLPSEQPEPFGGVVIESMASGRAVVGTKTGGTCEQIVDGVTGFLIPPGDPPAMAGALRRLLNDQDLRAQMGREGRNRFERYFEFERFYARVLELYESVLPAPQVGG